MPDEPQPINEEDNEPATRGDLATWGGQLQSQINDVKADVNNVKGRLTKVEDNTSRILTVVESIDEHFKEHRDLPAQVRKNTEDIFKLKMKR